MFHHLIVGLEAPTRGKMYGQLANAGRLRASADGPPCGELTVLDVAPASHIKEERAEIYLRLVR